MNFKIEKGCVFEAFQAKSGQVLAHQANTEGKMRSGIAREISERYPEMVEADAKHHKQYGTIDSLGLVSIAAMKRDFEGRIWTGFGANLYGQTLQGDGRRTNYEALSRSMELLVQKTLARNQLLREKGMKENTDFLMPYNIGCKLGGGSWIVVEAIIRASFESTDFNVTCYDNS